MTTFFKDLIGHYRTWIFDCDGVIIDSNAIKADAFFAVASPFGLTYAKALAEFHRANGGLSRIKKFEYFQTSILGRPFDKALNERLCQGFAAEVTQKLLICPMTRGFANLHQALQHSGATTIVLSATPEDELRQILGARGLLSTFQGVYGSPTPKFEHLQKLLKQNQCVMPAIFIGDAKVDYEAAVAAGLDFVFLRHYSEAKTWFEEKILGRVAWADTFEDHIIYPAP